MPIVAAQLCNRVTEVNNTQARELLARMKVARNVNLGNFIFIDGGVGGINIRIGDINIRIGDIEIRIGEIKNDFHTYRMN